MSKNRDKIEEENKSLIITKINQESLLNSLSNKIKELEKNIEND